MKVFGGFALLASANGLKIEDWLKTKYQNTQLNNVNTQNLMGANSPADLKEIMLNLNANSPQMGMTPMQLMMTSGASGLDQSDIMADMKNNMMNQMHSKMQSAAINPMLLQYAKDGGSINSGTFSKDHMIYAQFPDPMGTILRLKKNPSSAISKRGDVLMKRMVARNLITDDPILPDLFVDNDKQKIKDYLFAKQLETADPYMKTLLYRKFNPSGTATGGAASIGTDKELIQTKIIAEQFGESINEVAPNDAYLMFKFIKASSDANNGKVPANVILDVALGSDVAGIKAADFQENFGVTATEFVCAAHEESIRVPCMVNQETVTPGECSSKGCCYNTLSGDGATSHSNGGAVPVCYHNLLGKIGGGIARRMIKDDNIAKLFGGELPKLEDLTEAQTWAESQMPDVLRRLNKAEGDFYGNPSGQVGWWDNVYDANSGKFNIYATPAPKTKKFIWDDHGPTMMPNAGKLQIPEIGGFLSAEDPTVNDLDFIIGSHMEALRGSLNSDSYTCRLISKENMVNCYDNNFDALSTATDPAGACEAKGCCFREVNLFEKDNLPVCYRSLRSGYCDMPVTQRMTNPTSINGADKRDIWWKGNPYREECGASGISRGECLLNPQCCFDTNPRQEGEPFCYKRGGVESLFNQKTGEMGNQCDLTAVQLRVNCFDNVNKMGKLLNRIATESQCITAGCCFSQAAASASQALGIMGTMNMAGPHCFKKATDLDNNGPASDNYAQLQKLTPSDLQKVCANDAKWPMIKQREWVEQNGRWVLENSVTKSKAISRQACTANGETIIDRHSCVYQHGCCFEKGSDPINPWCYKSRLVKK